MARNRQGASVADEGLFPFRRRVRCTVEVGVSFAEAERAGRICLAEPVSARALLEPCEPGRCPPGSGARGSCG